MTDTSSPRRRPGSSPKNFLDAGFRRHDGLCAFLIAFCLLQSALVSAARTEIKNGQFYVDGEPFYIVAVGYNGLRPHQNPGMSYAETNRHWTELDFKRIRAAHFNTIRTWDALTPDELALANRNNLMVIQGIWLDPHQNFADSHVQDSCAAIVQNVAEQSKDFSNVLGYLIMTEPSADAVLESGEEETLRFFRRMKRTIQNIDPRPVSMDSWIPLAFLDHSLWDFVTFNTFAFAPASVNASLGFAGYNRWLVDRFAADRPFFVGETGGYSVSKSSFSKFGGYGGLTEYDQSLKNLESLRGTIEGHASGAAIVSWIDTWYYPKNSGKHEDEPWSWDGILGIPTDSKKDMDGLPRQIYGDLTVYNEGLIIEPKANHLYPVNERIPIQVYTAENVAFADYNLNGGEWKPLDGSGHGWFRGFFQLPKTAKHVQRLTVRVLDDTHTILTQKKVSFISQVPLEHVTLGLLNVAKKTGILSCTVHVTDGQQKPIANRKVTYGFYFPSGWRETQATGVTNEKGEIELTCPLAPQSDDHFLFVSAGTDSIDRIRAGDMRLFKLGS